MFYDIYITIFDSFQIFFEILGIFSFFYFIAWIGAKYEGRHRQRKKA